jgi:hypothetical protein
MSTRLELGSFVVEFFIDRKSKPETFHYIVMRKGSRDIEAWGQAASQQECEHEARNAAQVLADMPKRASNE